MSGLEMLTTVRVQSARLYLPQEIAISLVVTKPHSLGCRIPNTNSYRSHSSYRPQHEHALDLGKGPAVSDSPSSARRARNVTEGALVSTRGYDATSAMLRLHPNVSYMFIVTQYSDLSLQT